MSNRKKISANKDKHKQRPSMHNPDVFWIRESFGFVYAISLRKGMNLNISIITSRFLIGELIL